MKRLISRSLLALFTFTLGLEAHRLWFITKVADTSVTVLSSPSNATNTQEAEAAVEPPHLRDLFIDEEALHYNGYTVEKRYKRVKLAEFDSEWSDVPYVVITKSGRPVHVFDAQYYHPRSNFADFCLFSILGTSTKQLIISEDNSRGGTQQVIALAPSLRVLFDGSKWRVGRESDDFELQDLDADGVYEIIVPITDFYDLQDKMAIAQIPLPSIIFRYDKVKGEYFPANETFASGSATSAPQSDELNTANELYYRSRVVANVLSLVYSGKREDGWRYFQSIYNLADKKEMEGRIKNILQSQPVYRYIYNHGQKK